MDTVVKLYFSEPDVPQDQQNVTVRQIQELFIKDSQKLTTFENTIFVLIREALYTNKEQVRVLGMHLLDSLISYILCESAVQHRNNIIIKVFTVLLDKVKDIYCVLQSVNMILDIFQKCLTLCPEIFDEAFTEKLLKNCSSPVLHVPAYNQQTRNTVLKIYQKFVLNKELLLSKIDASIFINAVLTGTENEKDPRNLVICYDLIYFILRMYANNPSDVIQTTRINPFLDDIFDRISFYFPINFVPPKNNKYQITPQLLKDKLNKCFLASSILADRSFPFILDKIQATQVETKIESLQLIQEMIQQYEPYSHIQKHLPISLHHVSNEYFNQFDENLQQQCALTLALILGKMFEQSQQGVFLSENVHYLSELVDKCMKEIDEGPESMNAYLSSELISLLVVQNAQLQELVLDKVLSQIFIKRLIDNQLDSISQKTAYIQSIINIVNKIGASKINFMALNYIEQFIGSHLMWIVQQCFQSFSLSGSDTLASRQQNQAHLRQLPQSLDAQHFNCNISEHPILFEKGLKLLIALAKLPIFDKICSEETLMNYVDIFTTLLFSKLKQDMQKVLIEQLEELAILKPLLMAEITLPKLKATYKIETPFKNEQVLLTLNHLLRTFKSVEEIFEMFLEILTLEDVKLEYQPFVDALFSPINNVQLTNEQEKRKFEELLVCSYVGIINKVFENKQHMTNPVVISFLKKLCIKVPNAEKYLFSSYYKNPDLVLRLIKLVVKSQSVKLNSCIQEITEILNSILQHDYNNESLGREFGLTVQMLLLRESQNLEESSRAFANRVLLDQSIPEQIKLYICKACILRGDQSGYTYLISAIQIPALQAPIVYYFGETIAKKQPYLTKENGFTVCKLYTQRLFNTLYPLLLKMCEDTETRSFGIKLMMHTCSLVKLNQLQPKLSELIPIAEKALGFTQATEIQQTALALFRKIITDEKSLGQQYLDSFVPYLLDSLGHESLDIKIESLHTLTQISTYPSIQISKYANAIIKKITPLLDDQKRIVRKFARHCTNEWQTLA